MRKPARQILVLAGILFFICVFCRLFFVRGYTAVLPVPEGRPLSGPLHIEDPEPGIVAAGEPSVDGNQIRIHFDALTPGTTLLNLTDDQGDSLQIIAVQVKHDRTVIVLNDGGFTGENIMLVASSLFFLLTSAIMLYSFFRTKGVDFYAYSTIHHAGFSLFSLLSGLSLGLIAARHLTQPALYRMNTAYDAMTSMSFRFLLFTCPLILVFSLAMLISNAALLRHEKPRIQNALGILIAILMTTGAGLAFLLYSRDFSGSETEWRIQNTLQNVYATVYVYFECMLAGSVICGLKAAHHQPAPDRDAIIILGCYFRPDGSLPPLLKSRADRAIDFWKNQLKVSGKRAYLIPSGGQGPDETMPEAEAMRRYLVDQGIPDTLILPENQSRNTYQNMKLSKEIIASLPNAEKTAYATTNYHVFRSGVWANQAGLEAEGIGSKTVWWFWPNAFMRECIGLLAWRWKQEALLLTALVLFFGVLSMFVQP